VEAAATSLPDAADLDAAGRGLVDALVEVCCLVDEPPEVRDLAAAFEAEPCLELCLGLWAVEVRGLEELTGMSVTSTDVTLDLEAVLMPVATRSLRGLFIE